MAKDCKHVSIIKIVKKVIMSNNFLLLGEFRAKAQRSYPQWSTGSLNLAVSQTVLDNRPNVRTQPVANRIRLIRYF